MPALESESTKNVKYVHKFLVQGLSHYLEHMLFMGSEKYPDENEYDSFLAKNGGSSNAYTEMVSLSTFSNHDLVLFDLTVPCAKCRTWNVSPDCICADALAFSGIHGLSF